MRRHSLLEGIAGELCSCTPPRDVVDDILQFDLLVVDTEEEAYIHTAPGSWLARDPIRDGRRGADTALDHGSGLPSLLRPLRFWYVLTS